MNCKKKQNDIWGALSYHAWCGRFGTPEAYAKFIKRMPLRELYFMNGSHLNDMMGKRVLLLLGLHGNIAVALAFLGAEVTVMDYSTENKKYALELSEKCGVSINYVVADEELNPAEFEGNYDYVIIHGKLHYFTDINRLFSFVETMLHPHGRWVLSDYHPFKKIVDFSNGSGSAEGDYFAGNINGKAPQYRFLSEQEQEQLDDIPVRYWNFTDIFNEMMNHQLEMEYFHEEAGPKLRFLYPKDAPVGVESRIPGTVSIVFKKKQTNYIHKEVL